MVRGVVNGYRKDGGELARNFPQERGRMIRREAADARGRNDSSKTIEDSIRRDTRLKDEVIKRPSASND